MKATGGQKVRTGIFALIGLGLLVGAVFLIGKTKNLFGDTFHVYGTFKNVGGLQAGNNVRFVGVNVGTVQSISIISDTLARVDLIVQESVHKFIKSNAVASIGSDGLMGDKLIVISAADDGTQPVKDGARIATNNPTDMGEIVAKMQRIADNAEVITAGLADISMTISQGKGSLGRLLYNDDLAKNLEGTVTNIKQGTKGFSENMEALKGNFLLRGYYKRKERKKEEKEEARQAKEAEKAEKKDQPKIDKKKK
ncbi:MCE family protein [Flavipsychrobacter stenotrophus]|uniref:MCE family protein n=1 Tax=Flavipsychrobacter stenotrophus TaxID=2077091 RepID=A0A2S7SY15_9BACT|nr:MlaD family protein [Flavipsychrobacter stenotrophus]PQJ11521.1 MCE family protein [Flavipsychrobacter stenotrophus]